MSPEALKFIAEERSKLGIMLRFKNGKVYWLKEHYRYLDPEDATAVLLGNGKPIQGSRPSNRDKQAQIIYLS